MAMPRSWPVEQQKVTSRIRRDPVLFFRAAHAEKWYAPLRREKTEVLKEEGDV